MNSPRELSGVFVATSIPSPCKSSKRSKAPSSCYPTQARGREEVTQSVCSPSGTSFTRRLSPGVRETSPEPKAIQRQRSQVQRQTSGRPLRGGQIPTSPCTSLQLPSRIPRPSGRKPNAEATKTLHAIDGALRAVQTALIKTKLAAVDCSPIQRSEDLESLCGTECTESTACSSSFSEDGGADSRRLSSSLKDARRTMKERMGAEARSVRFTRGLLAKLDELRDAVAEDSSEAA